jgi:hypothetical protein
MNRTSTLPTLALAALIAACGGGTTSSGSLQDQARNAMPRGENLQVKAPTSTNLKDDRTVEQDSTVGQGSGYFAITVGVALVINGSTAVTLGLIKSITDFPATSCTEDTCTWGPGSSALDANNYKLVVTKKTDPSERFEYALSGQAKTRPGSDFVTFISGTAVPSGTPHRGTGTLVIDWDARAKLDNAGNDTGKLTIDYSNTGNATLSATALGVRDGNLPNHKLNVKYGYGENADGSGDLELAIHDLVNDARLSLHSRWKATGAGRGDAQFKQDQTTVTASECWGAASAAFKVVFWTDSLPIVLGPTSGVETDCAFSPAVLATLTVD